MQMTSMTSRTDSLEEDALGAPNNISEENSPSEGPTSSDTADGTSVPVVMYCTCPWEGSLQCGKPVLNERFCRSISVASALSQTNQRKHSLSHTIHNAPCMCQHLYHPIETYSRLWCGACQAQENGVKQGDAVTGAAVIIHVQTQPQQRRHLPARGKTQVHHGCCAFTCTCPTLLRTNSRICVL